MIKISKICLLLLEFRYLLKCSDAFSTNVVELLSSKPKRTSTRKIISYAKTLTSNDGVMGGVDLFDEWWSKMGPNDKIRHSSFEYSELRGLEYLGSSNSAKELVRVPRNFVVRSAYPDNEKWDSNLAVKLLKECMLGKKSEIYGLVLTLFLHITIQNC